MTTLHWRTPHFATEDNFELARTFFVSDTHANTLYSTLSRHTLRRTPYAAQDLNCQIQAHVAATPRATKVLDLGTRILSILARITHCCPSALPTLLDSLRVLTAGRTPYKKEKQDWRFTNQTAHILSMNIREMDSENLIKLGEKGLDSLLKFVQTHLISRGSRWLRKKAYAAWSTVQESLTTTLYDIITELLRLQN